MSPIEITVNSDGPYRVTGAGIILKDASGKTWDLAGRQAIALCRCGESSNKPFCDGTHKTVGFASRCEAGVLQPPQTKPKA